IVLVMVTRLSARLQAATPLKVAVFRQALHDAAFTKMRPAESRLRARLPGPTICQEDSVTVVALLGPGRDRPAQRGERRNAWPGGGSASPFPPPGRTPGRPG